MSEGIGASVTRKEDKKFLTGKGRYTDDINRPGQTHAYFVRVFDRDSLWSLARAIFPK